MYKSLHIFYYTNIIWIWNLTINCL